jgi:hypothetical protein
MTKYLITFISFAILFSVSSCTSTITSISDLSLTDKKYDSGFPQIHENQKIDELVNSVKMINCLAYYKSFLFDSSFSVTKQSLKNSDFKKFAAASVNSTETESGTATIIYSIEGKVALLTCAHILNFPDTIVTFHTDNRGNETNIIETVSIKTSQTILLPEYSFIQAVDILVMDETNDIAIVGKDFESENFKSTKPFKLKFGSANELNWGTKVYMIGFPLNYKMITSGLVSLAKNSDNNYFLVDAVFNRGFSGGIVLALRDGAPNFEIVGMIKSGTVHKDYKLKPNIENPDFNYLPHFPYTGEVLVEKETNIKYGITKILTINKILEFVEDHKNELKELGYLSEKFFN